MADVLLLKDRAGSVEFYPPARPASATLVFRSPSGTSLATPTVSVDALSRTVSAADTSTPSQRFTAATGTGTPVLGRGYWWTSVDSGGHSALVRLAELASSVWTLEAPVPGATAVQVGDTLTGARLTASVPSSATDELGQHYSLEWTVTGADGAVSVYQQTAHVCRTLYLPAMDPARAAAFAAEAYPSHYLTRPWGYWRRVAERAAERVWKEVAKNGRFPHLIGNSDAFAAAGEVALEIELAAQSIVRPSVVDADGHRLALGDRLKAEVEDAISGQRYDEDDSGSVDDGDEGGALINYIAAVRR